MIPFSVLDLSPIVAGGTAADSLRNTLDLAQHAERWGYNRYWLAEHHGMPGVASAATSVVIGHVAGGTRTIRVGAGGIMLPNHAPLLIAEQFGTLASLYPGRIDLGLGRAPGSDQAVSRALRRTMSAADTFPQDVTELMAYFQPAAPGQSVQAVPGAGLDVPIWILGSSLYGAQLAAALGLPYAFASHFAPRLMEQAMDVYRSSFQPSAHLEQPYVMLGVNVSAAAPTRPPLVAAGCHVVRRRARGGGAATVHIAAASVHQPAHGAPGAAAPARRRPRAPAAADAPDDDRRDALVHRRRIGGDRSPRAVRLRGGHRSRRADGHVPDLRSSRAAPVVRAHREGPPRGLSAGD